MIEKNPWERDVSGLGVEGTAAKTPSVWMSPPISRQEETPTSPLPTPSLLDSREHAPRLTSGLKVCVPIVWV